MALLAVAPASRSAFGQTQYTTERRGGASSHRLKPGAPAPLFMWTLDTLTAATQQRGIQVARCHVRRIFVQERVRAYQHTPVYGKALRKRKV